MFQKGDIVFIPDVASILSMTFYSEHSEEFDCPCKWRGRFARVEKIFGNFVYVIDQDPPHDRSAFHHKDLRFARHEEVDV